ncbi:uncharacterized protein MYCFIDRAFT_195150 [Pseudocercospora fijiensis CIRAD86]|uniref:Survival motor neuron Tudor domain-containing protein n=1 Tax=Pseudocercospora fijiensis (strain CIRAD86) TaxID=383855 RepID=M2ZYD8_PSEFD|nr:uncharacterized protein MYCFIDRAFT_195150 [Pseudocercospora fijiensis CIRAD86]EME83964.1 hypothetical protein MYCFIDRAFT_195150 [Pseudocercospora fijiensis CIRAD86]
MANHAGGELSHEEVWDDSDLVQNWNDAFEEYKKYHSLAARGEQVQSSSASKATSGPNGALKPSTTPANFVPALVASQAETASSAPQPVAGPAGTAQTNVSALPPAPHGLGSLLPTLVSSSLYEGQQKAWASMQEPQQEG